MIAVVAIFLIACIAGSMAEGEIKEEHMKKFIEYAVDCGKENDVDPKVFDGIQKGQMPDPKLFEEKKYRCYTKCVSLKCGFINEAGEPQVDKLKEVFQMKDDSFMDEIKKCYAEITDKDLCDKAYKIHKCALDKIPKKP